MKKVFALVAIVVLLTSCATIMKGSKRTVEINTVPPGASFELDGMKYTTPSVVTLAAKNEHIIKFNKEGYKEASFKLNTKITGWFWGNLCIGGLIGIIVDMSNGAAYEFDKSKILVTLEQL